MKLRYKVLAVVMSFLKPVLVPLMSWYAKRKMRKQFQEIQEEMPDANGSCPGCMSSEETVERKKGEGLSDLFSNKKGDTE